MDGASTITEADRATIMEDRANRGDGHGRSGAPDHGQPEVRAGWWATGADLNRVQACNTWAASDYDVR